MLMLAVVLVTAQAIVMNRRAGFPIRSGPLILEADLSTEDTGCKDTQEITIGQYIVLPREVRRRARGESYSPTFREL